MYFKSIFLVTRRLDKSILDVLWPSLLSNHVIFAGLVSPSNDVLFDYLIDPHTLMMPWFMNFKLSCYLTFPSHNYNETCNLLSQRLAQYHVALTYIIIFLRLLIFSNIFLINFGWYSRSQSGHSWLQWQKTKTILRVAKSCC